MMGTEVASGKFFVVEERALRAFHEQTVDLSPEDTRLGRDLKDAIIRQIERLSNKNGFPRILANRSFVAGSFGRKTQSQPLDDIDIYIVLNSGGMPMIGSGWQHILEGTTRGPLTDDASLQVGGWVSSSLVLSRIASEFKYLPISNDAKEVGINKSGKSAFIKFGNLNVDLTPVFLARFNNAIDRYYMPEGQESPWWQPTNPREDQRRLTVQNQSQGELLLPTIRILKWWNDRCNKSRIPGIHLEVMVEESLKPHYLIGFR